MKITACLGRAKSPCRGIPPAANVNLDVKEHQLLFEHWLLVWV